MIKDDPVFFETDGNPGDFIEFERRWFSFVNRASKGVMLHFGNHLLDHLSGANVFDIFATLGSAGGMYTLLAPFFVAFSQFSKDRRFTKIVQERFMHTGEPQGVQHEELKAAHFTDTFYEVNGVALTLQQQVKLALAKHKQFTLVTCHKDLRAKIGPAS